MSTSRQHRAKAQARARREWPPVGGCRSSNRCAHKLCPGRRPLHIEAAFTFGSIECNDVMTVDFVSDLRHDLESKASASLSVYQLKISGQTEQAGHFPVDFAVVILDVSLLRYHALLHAVVRRFAQNTDTSACWLLSLESERTAGAHRPAASARSPYTVLPASTVARTFKSLMRSAGTVRMSPDSTTKSAYLPASIEPFTFSSKLV